MLGSRCARHTGARGMRLRRPRQPCATAGKGAHLERAGITHHPAGDLESVLERLAVDEIEAEQLLSSLRKWAIEHQRLAARPHRHGGRGGHQSTRGSQAPLASQRVCDGLPPGHDSCLLFAAPSLELGFEVIAKNAVEHRKPPYACHRTFRALPVGQWVKRFSSPWRPRRPAAGRYVRRWNGRRALRPPECTFV